MQQSEETVLDDDAVIGDPTTATLSSNITTTTEPNITATIGTHGTPNTNTGLISHDATASPDPTSESAAATRRGLRARRPAQQRPYSLDAEIYEESDADVMEEEPVAQAPPETQSRRVSIASLSREPIGQLDDETLAILQGSVDREPEEEQDTYGRTKHFKGKGRAWKKEESDEDLEFNPGKKKSAKAKAKAKAAAAAAAAQQPKKRGRPRKSNLSEDVIRDDSDDEAPAKAADASPSPAAPESAARKTRKPSRKSVLSEELVHDDTDGEEEEVADARATEPTTLPEVSTPAASKRGRPRKSDQSVSSKASVTENEEARDTVSYTPNGTPSKSHTPKGEPKQASTSVEKAAPMSKAFEEESPAAPPPADIEAHMASVNAEDDDDDEELCK
jgi:hypothetical protein